MLGKFKTSFAQKREQWAQETHQRIQEYGQEQQTKMMEKTKREVEERCILQTETEKYLQTVHPSFLLKPEAAKALLNMLYARSEGKKSLSITMTRDMRKTLSFYQQELNIFLRIVEKKGFTIKGNEELFLEVFLNKLSKNNYAHGLHTYGDFIEGKMTLDGALNLYFDLVDDQNRYDVANLDFLVHYFYNKEIVSVDYTIYKLKKKIKRFEKVHEEECKIRRMEKRLEQIAMSK